jgi:hypothetical protein
VDQLQFALEKGNQEFVKFYGEEIFSSLKLSLEECPQHFKKLSI